MKGIISAVSATIIILFLSIATSCTNDQLPEPTLPEGCEDAIPTYNDTIGLIIENSCAYAGCHLDGSAPGIYDSYEAIVAVIESGNFNERVIIQRDDANVGMPPNFAPEGRPKDLTQEELDLIICWVENGYPEE